MTGAPTTQNAKSLHASVAGLILAGGEGRRMGGVDKGLQPFRGRALIEWVLERFEPQVDEILMNANQNLDRYLGYGYPVVRDRITGFAGPLAGLHAALVQARCELVVTVPCDSPFLPADLVRRLSLELERTGAEVAFAKTLAQPHPVFALCRTSLADHLSGYLESGGRKVDAWYATLNAAEVGFDDQAHAFRNINTLEDLRTLEQEWRTSA